MRTTTLFAVSLLFLLSIPSIAQEGAPHADSRFICGTSETNDARVAAVHAWSTRKAERLRGKVPVVADSVWSTDGVVLLEADEFTAPFHRPLDLEGMSIALRRTSDGRFAASKRALDYSADLGMLLRNFNGERTPPALPYALQSFAFPFAGGNATTLYLSPFNAVFFSDPGAPSDYQHGPLEVVTSRTPRIAPLLLADRFRGSIPYPQVWVKEGANEVRITWKSQRLVTTAYEIQLVLRRSGDIVMSYKSLKNVSWGAVAVVTGAESWRSDSGEIGRANDATSDVSARFDPAKHPLLDIESATAERVAGTDLIRFRIRLAAPFDRTLIAAGDVAQYIVDLSPSINRFEEYLYFDVSSDGTMRYYVPGWGDTPPAASASIDGSEIVLEVLDGFLNATGLDLDVVFATSLRSSSYLADTITARVDLTGERVEAMTDISALTGEVVLDRPLVEAFTLPVLDPYTVWDRVKRRLAVTDSAIDGVAIYQSFHTDIVFYAGAYSTGGNPGVSGISAGRSTIGLARSPALLHMNTIDYGYNSTSRGSTHVSLHEFGHRWLYHLRIKEGEEVTRSLNPLSAHPAQYVHTPSAFPVYGEGESSVMGGGVFTDHGNGSFSTATVGSYGFSWTDLYLMGLASREEVSDWFYIANSSPALGGAYYPPSSSSWNGERRNVTVQQIVDALGPRLPSSTESQKEFRVVFVLLLQPGEEYTPALKAKMDEHRRGFETSFSAATGQRGSVSTVIEPPKRKRAVRR